MADLEARLLEVLAAQHLEFGDSVGADYSHDEALTAAPVRPLAVARPVSADEVSAILRVCDELGVPVTARGAGTGLSGACIPSADGVVLSLERMNEILEIDVDNYVAVVQPGVSLDQLDAVLAPLGLVYPVYPGENSASLGGNVATNAGGMRAVKYGVTRNQVLGLQAVLAGGEVIRTGGKFVKATTGYDLTQLIIGSEGTLAIVTEAVLKIYPRPQHNATLLVPFASVEEIASAVPNIVRSGVDPLVLEYVDGGGLATLTANVGLDLGISAEVQTAASAYLIVVLEQHVEQRLDEDVAALAELVGEFGRDRRLRAPTPCGRTVAGGTGEGVLGREGARRERHHRRRRAAGVGAGIPPGGGGGRDRARVVRERGRACRRRQHSPLGVPARRRDPSSGDERHHRSRCRDGWRDLGRARHRHGEEGVLSRAGGPEQDRADAPDQGCLRSERDTQPRNDVRLSGVRPARHGEETDIMNGANAVLRTLVANGVTTCFTNPGTSEMHFVAALDEVPAMRAVLALFEGVATGAADGYGRMNDRRPAATLLHLGPGLGNGLANLHNARRARTPIVNIVGDHATYHQRLDAPLASDIVGVAENVSLWVRESEGPQTVGADTTEAIEQARRGGVATLILPADTSWSEGARPGSSAAAHVVSEDYGDAVVLAAKALRSGEPSALLLGGQALREGGLSAAARIAAATGAKLLCETFPARLERGAGLPAVERLGYLAEFAIAQLQGLRHLVLVDAREPVSFFAYPNLPSELTPEGCEVHELVTDGVLAPGALQALADAVGAPADGAMRSAAATVRIGRPDR